jgi:hypothetical protein
VSRYHLRRIAQSGSGSPRGPGKIRGMLAPRHRMKCPVPLPYAGCVAVGLLVGLLFGDLMFPNFETAVGDPLADTLLGIFGGVFAGIACEIASEIRALFSWPRRRRRP